MTTGMDDRKDAFDWQLQSMPGMGYVLVTSGPTGEQGPSEPGFINGGMLSRADAPTRGPLIVVDVESIEDTLRRIGELGGETVLGRQPVGTMGFSAYVRDTEGNVIGLWQTA